MLGILKMYSYGADHSQLHAILSIWSRNQWETECSIDYGKVMYHTDGDGAIYTHTNTIWQIIHGQSHNIISGEYTIWEVEGT